MNRDLKDTWGKSKCKCPEARVYFKNETSRSWSRGRLRMRRNEVRKAKGVKRLDHAQPCRPF